MLPLYWQSTIHYLILYSSYIRRQAAAEAAAAEKRAKKGAAELRADSMEEDVFGARVINDVHMQGVSSPED